MAISIQEVNDVFKAQEAFFRSGATRSYAFRKKAIKDLQDGIKEYEEKILKALYDDLHKPHFEAYSSEIGFLNLEIKHSLKWLKEWMRPQQQPTPLVSQPASSYIYTEPKGPVLILSPWNYPFNLVMAPLLTAISAGNTALIKLPQQTPAVAKVIDELITAVFPKELVTCISIEDKEVIPSLIHGLRFKHIFFTGSSRVGKLIYTAAAEHLIPVTLELGGKSPVIVDSSADLKIAARRIIWGKCFNAGQTCIAPDHVFVHSAVKEAFMKALLQEADDFMKAYQGQEHFTYLIHDARFKALEELLKGEKVVFESERDAKTRYFGLCIVDEPSMESKLMKEEIFGPILPILSWSNEEELLQKLAMNPEPLSFYLFSKDKKLEERLVHGIPFGGGCLNDCMLHFASADLPFGGVGNSGLGRYHGKEGFDALSNKKAFIRNNTWLDIPVRYAPYSSWKNRIMKLFMR